MENTKKRKSYFNASDVRWALFRLFVFNWFSIVLYIAPPVFALLNAGGGDCRVFWIGVALFSFGFHVMFIVLKIPLITVREEFLESKTFEMIKYPLLVLLSTLLFGIFFLSKGLTFRIPHNTIAYLGTCDTFQMPFEKEKKSFPMMSVQRMDEGRDLRFKPPYFSVLLQANKGNCQVTQSLQLGNSAPREIPFVVDWEITYPFPMKFFVGRAEPFGYRDILDTARQSFDEFSKQYVTQDINKLQTPKFLAWVQKDLSTKIPNVTFKLRPLENVR